MAIIILLYITALFLWPCDFIDENLHFASYYGDHMVLQKAPDRAVLWGYGPEGAQVTVFLSGPFPQTTKPVIVTEGTWLVTLDPVEAGGPYNVTAALQGITVVLTDVLFGEVWLCGGQSNMAFTTSQVFNASEELALASHYPRVRLFMAALKLNESEQTDLAGVDLAWSVPTTSNLGNFSAVCWLFGRYLYDHLKHPIGLVESCWSGTPIEAWSSSRALQQCGLNGTADILDDPKKANSVLWNAMIHPFRTMTLKGVIWYQGEANEHYHQDQYNCTFPAMIADWRTSFHQGSGGQTASDFPFGFVQISTENKGSLSEDVPNIRWHQTADVGFVPNLKLPRTFMAVAMDLPDETSPYGTIHPRDKQDVAYRLILGARAVAYGYKDVHFLGPFPNKTLVTGSSLIITYDQAISVTQSEDIFQISCSGPQSIWHSAPIMTWDLNMVQVSSSMCKPSDNMVVTGLRYAWKDWPCDFKACPIYSANKDLPAPPFKIILQPGIQKESVENQIKYTLMYRPKDHVDVQLLQNL